MAIVLIVDDKSGDVENIKNAIEGKGHGVIYCACSRDAQEEIRRKRVDCAIYDGCLPRYSDSLNASSEWGGVFLARETKRFLPHIPCVVYTHGLDEEIVKELIGMHVPVHIKDEARIEAILKDLRL